MGATGSLKWYHQSQIEIYSGSSSKLLNINYLLKYLNISNYINGKVIVYYKGIHFLDICDLC